MNIGFAKHDITPPIGVELGGYAGYRPCNGVHDPLFCKALVLNQDGIQYALIALDLLSIDESLHLKIAQTLEHLGLSPQRTIVAAIHSHASPCGIIRGTGPLARINQFGEVNPTVYDQYMNHVIQAVVQACSEAIEAQEPFRIRVAQGPLPVLGAERHTGEAARGIMTAIQFLTDSRKSLIVYHFPCHPTVMRPDNLLASADFIGGIEGHLSTDMSIFLNGAAGDISTRFTRRESTFAECDRLAALAASTITQLLDHQTYCEPDPLKGISCQIAAKPRQADSLEQANAKLADSLHQLKSAEQSGADPATLRILQSCVEGAGVNLEFAETMQGITQLHLPITAFTFCGLKFITIPGELYSTLPPKGILAICYANGYYRYITDMRAYDENHYEAMAAILARGEGEKLISEINLLFN